MFPHKLSFVMTSWSVPKHRDFFYCLDNGVSRGVSGGGSGVCRVVSIKRQTTYRSHGNPALKSREMLAGLLGLAVVKGWTGYVKRREDRSVIGR